MARKSSDGAKSLIAVGTALRLCGHAFYAQVRQAFPCVEQIGLLEGVLRTCFETSCAVAAHRFHRRVVVKFFVDYDFAQEEVAAASRDDEVGVLPYPTDS